MKQVTHTLALIFFFLFTTTNFVNAQRTPQEKVSKAELKKLKAAVEKSPDSLSFHQAYIKAMGIENPELEKQYNVWMKKSPKVMMFPYALGDAYKGAQSPKTRVYLLKAVEIDPTYTEAWGGLWSDGERWGDFVQSREYLRKATESDPSNAHYAFYYASSFDAVDRDQYVEKSLDVVKRFPQDERGAQALYWFGTRSLDAKDRMKFYEMLYTNFAPEKFRWSSSGMNPYFNLLLTHNPEKAVELATALAKEEQFQKEWPALVVRAKNILAVKNLNSQAKFSESLAILNAIPLTRRDYYATDLSLLKALTNDLAGNTKAAYDSLIVAFTKSPNVDIKAALIDYGRKAGKNKTEVEADIWNPIDKAAKQATSFNLKRYDSEAYTSLEDYKGKVVLLTYWYPGCGPCRGEFPHFQNVVNRFNKDDLAYVGINITSQQNEYVNPFLKSSGYTFTPLEDVKGRDKGNLDNRGAAPVNFLIDQNGRVVFSNFTTHGDTVDELELMIDMLLDQKKS